MIKFDVMNRWSGEVQFTAEIDCAEGEAKSVKLGLAVKWGIKASADLTSANLYGADLRSANLRSANLTSADLTSANLYGADLRSANLRSANLTSANLRSADLRSANLRSANLRSADLRSADLRSANLRSANLRSADLPSFQIPQEGPLHVWKKLREGLCKLIIPETAARTASVVGRKCRAESALVVAIFDRKGKPLQAGTASHDGTPYTVGQIITPDKYDPNPAVECSNGIHFFLTKEEAEVY